MENEETKNSGRRKNKKNKSKKLSFQFIVREEFLRSLCNHCKIILGNDFYVCEQCGLVNYCCEAHAKDDFGHEDLCEVLKGTAKDLGCRNPLALAKGTCPEDFRKYRLSLIGRCSSKLERYLDPCEMEICLFPHSCWKCHRVEALELCSTCRFTAWCSNEHEPPSHSDHCSDLLLLAKLRQTPVKTIQLPAFLPSKPKDSKSAWSGLSDMEAALASEISTAPFTCLLAAKPTKKSNLVIHLVGAEPDFEANNLQKWEHYLFHFLPCKSLLIEFVGPEMASVKTDMQMCTGCENSGRRIEFRIHNKLYHSYRSSSAFTSPDIIAIFNPGLYRTTGFNGKDTWEDTIKAIFSIPNVTVLVTAYTRAESHMDWKRVNNLTDNVNTLEEPKRNPFSSLKPLLNFVTEEETPVSFKNAYVTLLETKS